MRLNSERYRATFRIFTLLALFLMFSGVVVAQDGERSDRSAGELITESALASDDERDNRSAQEIVEDLAYDIRDEFLDLIPGLIWFIIIILIGYIIAKLVGAVLTKVLNRVGFDALMTRVNVDQQVKKMGFQSVSKLLGVLLFWFVFAMALQVALEMAGIVTLSNVLSPIVLFIPRAIIAVIVVLVGLYVAEVAVDLFRKFLSGTPIGKDIIKMDKKTKRSGISILSLVSIFIKVFILLIFVQVALELVAISVLSDFINPVLLAIPLILLAMGIILIGLIVTEYVIKLVVKLLREFEFDKLIAPVEETIRRKGIVMQILTFLLQVLIMLFFVQLAIGVLNETGQFDMFATLLNDIILWMPRLIAALFIVLVGFWAANWAHDKTLAEGKKMDVPFVSAMALGVKFLIIYIAAVMAMDLVGFEVDILYILFAIVMVAVFIGVGVGFAYGSKDVFHNMMGMVQNQQAIRVGSTIKVNDYEGQVQKIDRYHVTLKTAKGTVRIPNSLLVKAVIEEK